MSINIKSGFGRFLVPCWLVLAILALSIAAGAAEIVLKVITVTANVRQSPGMTGKVVRTVTAGTLLSASTKEGEWYKVDLPAGPAGAAMTAYIHESVVSVVAGAAPQPAPVQTAPPPVSRKPEPPPQPAAPVSPVVQEAAPAAGKGFIIRPYAKVGLLLTPPSADDLGYTDVDDSSLEEYLDMNAFNFGGGAQFLLSLPRNPNLRIGMDVGFQTLFSSTFDTGAGGDSTIYTDYNKDSEFAVSLLGIVEYLPAGSGLILQGGLGGHFVFWTWRDVYESKYQSKDETESGMDFNFGLMAAAGLNLLGGQRLSIPILLRLDYIMRYGGYFNASLVFGFAFR